MAMAIPYGKRYRDYQCRSDKRSAGQHCPGSADNGRGHAAHDHRTAGERRRHRILEQHYSDAECRSRHHPRRPDRSRRPRILSDRRQRASSVTLSGDPALVNLTLTAGIVYTPAGDYNGSDTLTIATGDGGNTGTGGVQTDSDEIAITVGAQNDAPELTGLGDTASYTENGAAVVLDTDGNASVSDATSLRPFRGDSDTRASRGR